MVAASCLGILGATAYGLVHAGQMLVMRNFSINSTNTASRNMLGRLTRDIHMATAVPELVNASGNKVTLGASAISAAGVRVRKYVGGPFRLPTAVLASSLTVELVRGSEDPMPRVGDLLAIPASNLYPLPQDVYVRIVGVNPPAPAITTNPTVTLVSIAGAAMTPPAVVGTVAEADSLAHLVRDLSYIAVTANGQTAMRHYPRALSVSADTASVFDNSANFMVLTKRLSGSATPFQMTSGDRAVGVQIAVGEPTYSNRINSPFVKNFEIGTAVTPHRITYRTLGL